MEGLCQIKQLQAVGIEFKSKPGITIVEFGALSVADGCLVVTHQGEGKVFDLREVEKVTIRFSS